MTAIDITPYPFAKAGRNYDRAWITVAPARGDRKPGLDFQRPGTFFRGRDGKRWKILSSEVVETRSPFVSSREPVRECVYHWKYDAEAVIERPSSGSWEDEL